MNHNSVQHDIKPDADDEIDLRALLRQLWQGKKIILATALVATMCAVGFGSTTTRYVSEGLLQTNSSSVGISSYSFGKYADILSNEFNFKAYLDKKKDVSEQTMLLLRGYGASQERMNTIFSPIFMGSEKEQKLWGIRLDPEKMGQLFGVKISISAKEPNNGDAIALIEDYARETIARKAFGDHLAAMCEASQKNILSLNSSIVSIKFDIQQEEERILLLKPLADNPLLNGADAARQVVSVDGVSKNYLAPRVHVSASKVKVAELRLQNERNEMLIQEAGVKARFYCPGQETHLQWTGVADLLKQLDLIGMQAIAGAKINPDLAFRLKNEIQLEVANLRDGFQKRMKLTQPAEFLEYKYRKTSLRVFGGLGALLGLTLGCVIVLVGKWFRPGE